jgi:drug/metabolite transporter (DMT)-like permease
MTQKMGIRNWLVLLLTAGLFGSSFFFIKVMVGSIPPLTIATGRAGIAAIIVYGYMRLSDHRLPGIGKTWLPLILLGLLTAAIPYAAIAWGQTLIASSLGGILFATIPVFTVLTAPFFLPEERFTKQRLIGAVTGLCGVILVVGPQALGGLVSQVFGATITLIAAFSYAVGGIYARTQTHLSPIVTAAGQLTTASMILGGLSIIFEAPWTLTPTVPKRIDYAFCQFWHLIISLRLNLVEALWKQLEANHRVSRRILAHSASIIILQKQ